MWEALESRRLLSTGFVTLGATGPPENDNFSHAFELVGAQATANGTNAGATVETGEPSSLLGYGSVWYTWKAPANAYVGIFFSDFTFQSVNVFEGDSIGTLKEVTKPYSGTFGNEFRAVAGREYRIAVSASANNAGAFALTLRSGLPRVRIRAIDTTAAETRPGELPNTAAFQVKRTGSTDHALRVSYFIFNTAVNSATPGKDYVKLPGSVKIPAGKSSVKIVVHPIDDRLVELTETIDGQLSSLHRDYVTMDSRALVEILDNERHARTARARPQGEETNVPAVIFRKSGGICGDFLCGGHAAVW